jgi:hypothetical protein
LKSDIWGYEKEWRVWDLLPQRESQLFSYYPVSREEIGAVYLGCRIDSSVKNQILNLLSAYPNAKIFQASKANDEYKLDFGAL